MRIGAAGDGLADLLDLADEGTVQIGVGPRKHPTLRRDRGGAGPHQGPVVEADLVDRIGGNHLVVVAARISSKVDWQLCFSALVPDCAGSIAGRKPAPDHA